MGLNSYLCRKLPESTVQAVHIATNRRTPAHDNVLPSIVKWKMRDLDTSQRSDLRSYTTQSWRYQKDITMDPKSRLDRTIANEKGGQNAAKGKEQVMPFLRSTKLT
ncbi:Bgt-20993 [Blumeria graminis f. sp. tritici]|uniref:Bgt-20993 n=2 Tax=Blumeria graminis f. sp. tritici TaxID=62690 RepID=A0A9X9MN34_BLUGR|nr:Bgt-20993 [Blumeria graminis f. sp. tritici]